MGVIVAFPLRRSAEANFFADHFGLTPAEAELAWALIRTGNLRRAAAACALTDGSARQYLKSAYRKTRTAGQVELVVLLLDSLHRRTELRHD
jgi:DNA-binding CsgD family transcriptional regulator